jgi:hypothetical protein
MTYAAGAREYRPSKSTVAKTDPRYFDLKWFATPDDGETWVEARLEQVAAINANPDKVREAEQLLLAEELRNGKRRRHRRRRAAAAWPSADSTLGEGPLRDRFASLLPPRPYCSNDVKTEGVKIRPRDTALRHRHIQLNGPNVVAWFPYDVDRADAVFAAEDGNVKPPNFIAVNVAEGPRFGHAHLGYLLANPIQRFTASRREPADYGSAVQRGLRRRLGADPAYAGLITKNPLHPDWRVTWLRNEPYTLEELASCLFKRDMRRDPKRKATGLSRDNDCFDDTRQWAYKHVLAFKRAGGDLEAWIARCREIADKFNVFDEPLTPSDIRKLGRSVGRWTWRRFTEEGLSRRQAACGKRGLAKRWAGHASAEKAKPWEVQGISRATWYRRKAAVSRRLVLQRETIALSDVQSGSAGCAKRSEAGHQALAVLAHPQAFGHRQAQALAAHGRAG